MRRECGVEQEIQRSGVVSGEGSGPKCIAISWMLLENVLGGQFEVAEAGESSRRKDQLRASG